MDAQRLLSNACIEIRTKGVTRIERHTLARAAHELMNTRPADETIRIDAEPYLNRWWLEGSSREEGRRYLHYVEREDEDTPHDHPWDNVTLMLEGRMTEEWWIDGKTTGQTPRESTLNPGDRVFRQAEQIHRLKVAIPSLTLFATGPKRREWGFWIQGRWIDHHRYERGTTRASTRTEG